MRRRKKTPALRQPKILLGAWFLTLAAMVLTVALFGGTAGVLAAVVGPSALIGLQIMLAKTRPRLAGRLTLLLVGVLVAGLVVGTS